jgi:hypothetical protein
LENIETTLPEVAVPPAVRLRRREQILRACWSESVGLMLNNAVVVTYEQPVWFSITWRPLLYLCLRRWMSALDPVAVLLALELLEAFDPEIMAWRGPTEAVRAGAGASWASALGLRAAVSIGADLIRAGATPKELINRAKSLKGDDYEFDVAISFAGADRPTAETISERLKAAGLRVFYDRDHQHTLLGEDLAVHLHATYLDKSRFAVVIISRAFTESPWAGNWEWKAVLARMRRQQTGYVLPYVLEDVAVPGLSPTLGFVSASVSSPADFAEIVIRKVWHEHD